MEGLNNQTSFHTYLELTADYSLSQTPSFNNLTRPEKRGLQTRKIILPQLNKCKESKKRKTLVLNELIKSAKVEKDKGDEYK